HYIRHVETATRADGTTVRTETISARGFYRLAWRNMAANTGERTFIPTVIPPGAAHIHGVSSLGAPDGSLESVALVATLAGSLIHDFAVRSAPKSTISAATVERLPLIDGRLNQELMLGRASCRERVEQRGDG